MKNRPIDYDYVIVGGGIVGAGVFRELSLHHQKVLLIEKAGFMEQTSARSSKMLHGGIRYLETFDFDLVKEALKEKNLWHDLAPGFVSEQKFYIPIYKNSPHSLLKLAVGVKLYDLLSMFKNTPSGYCDKLQTLSEIPGLGPNGLKGAVTYHDAIMEDHLLGKAIIEKAANYPYSMALDHCELVSWSKNSHYHLKLRHLSEERNIACKNLIFCTGPFTDQVMQQLNIPWQPKMVLSKGSHLHLRKDFMNLPHPVVFQDGNRVIFLVPHLDYILLGTTEIALPPQTNIAQLSISDSEVEYLKTSFNEYFPKLTITDQDIIRTQSGARPLVSLKANTHGPGALSRNHLIFSPMNDCYVLIGGKWTTFRKMAADLVKMIFDHETKTYNPTLSYLKL